MKKPKFLQNFLQAYQDSYETAKDLAESGVSTVEAVKRGQERAKKLALLREKGVK